MASFGRPYQKENGIVRKRRRQLYEEQRDLILVCTFIDKSENSAALEPATFSMTMSKQERQRWNQLLPYSNLNITILTVSQLISVSFPWLLF